MNSFDYYKNMSEDQSHEFDSRWDNVSKQLGFQTSTAGNRLGYGSA